MNQSNSSITNRLGGEGINVAPSDDYWPSGCGIILLSDAYTLLHTLLTAITLYDSGYDITVYMIHSNNNENCNDYDINKQIINKYIKWLPDLNITNQQYINYASTTYSRLYNLLQYNQSGITISPHQLDHNALYTNIWYKSIVRNYNQNTNSFDTLQINTSQLQHYLLSRLSTQGNKLYTRAQLPDINDIENIKLLCHSNDSIVVDCRSKHTWINNYSRSVEAHIAINNTSIYHNITITQHRDLRDEPLIYICNHPYDASDQAVINTSYGCAKDVLSIIQKAHRIISSL